MLALFQPRRVESYSPSEYSQLLDDRTLMPTGDSAREIGYEASADKINVIMIDSDEQAQPIQIPIDEDVYVGVEGFVADGIQQGFFPFDADGRALALDQCVRSAMEDQDRTLWLIEGKEVKVQVFKTLHRSRKRHASEDVADLDHRPYKMPRDMIMLPNQPQRGMKRPANGTLRGHRRKWLAMSEGSGS